MFPSLFALAESRKAWVVEMWDSLGDEGGLNPCLLRPFNDWEVDALLNQFKGRK